MSTLAYDVSYRLVGDTGLARNAVVIIAASIVDTHSELRYRLAVEHAVNDTSIVDLFPVRLKVGTVWRIGK